MQFGELCPSQEGTKCERKRVHGTGCCCLLPGKCRAQQPGKVRCLLTKPSHELPWRHRCSPSLVHTPIIPFVQILALPQCDNCTPTPVGDIVGTAVSLSVANYCRDMLRLKRKWVALTPAGLLLTCRPETSAATTSHSPTFQFEGEVSRLNTSLIATGIIQAEGSFVLMPFGFAVTRRMLLTLMLASHVTVDCGRTVSRNGDHGTSGTCNANIFQP